VVLLPEKEGDPPVIQIVHTVCGIHCSMSTGDKVTGLRAQHSAPRSFEIRKDSKYHGVQGKSHHEP
jgi:hypothetical protein